MTRALVLGAPGLGKSFLAIWSAVDLAAEGSKRLQERQASVRDLPLPIHLDAAKLAETPCGGAPTERLIDLLVGQGCDLSASLRKWMRTAIPKKQCWLIVDAIDRVSGEKRTHLREWLSALDLSRPQGRTVLTCSVASYEGAEVRWGSGEYEAYELANFDWDRGTLPLIKKWFLEQSEPREALLWVLKRNPALRQACRSPLVTTLTCLAQEEDGLTEETRLCELYQRILRYLLRRITSEQLGLADRLELVRQVAWNLFQQNPIGNLFTDGEVLEAIKDADDKPVPVRITGELSPDAIRLIPRLLRGELLESGVLAWSAPQNLVQLIW